MALHAIPDPAESEAGVFIMLTKKSSGERDHEMSSSRSGHPANDETGPGLPGLPDRSAITVQDTDSVARIWVDKDSKLIMINSGALAEGPHNTLFALGTDNIVRFHNKSVSELVRKAFEPASGKGSDEVKPARWVDRKDKSWLFVSVCPVVYGKTLDAVQVSICTSDLHTAFGGDLWQHAFNLTSTEASLARMLLSGMSVSEISRIREVAESTVRTQLRSLFGKTGTKRQPELVALLLRTSMT